MTIKKFILTSAGIILAGLLAIGVARGLAASPHSMAGQQAGDSVITRVSVSALAFTPASPDIQYRKDLSRQLLALAESSRGSYTFTAPLFLPDKSRLVSMTVFGEDFDPQGAVQVRLKRCEHGQPRCIDLAASSSTEANASGQFDTGPIPVTNEIVDNNLYSYLLELELSALFNSGLRSVRLTLIENAGEGPEPIATWSLTGNITRFTVPTTGLSRVRICTDDLSHLDNVTHYPRLVVDGRTQTLGSNTCVTVWGQNIEIQRRFNTGPSSGTYQILQ